MQVGAKVRKLRELKNLTQEAIANELNISQSAYSRYESDTANWDVSKLEIVAKYLGITATDILGFNEERLLQVVNQNTFTAGSNPIIRNEIGSLSEQDRANYEDRIATLKAMIAMQEREIARLARKRTK